MNRKQKNILAILALIACGFFSAAGIYAYQTYRTFAQVPLGAALPEYTRISLPPTWTATVGTPQGAVTLAPTITLAPTNTIEPICSGPDVMNILAVGADSRQDAYIYGLADAIRIVRVEFKTPRVTILEFPRDLWVEIPYIADNLHGIDHGKLNQAYLFGQPGDGFNYWDNPSGGAGLLALTLNQNFGVQSDHYVTVNMRTFENIVNAMGGIDMTITDEETAKNTGLPIGANHLDGAGALKVARNREEGVFERANNQNRVLCALRKKILSPGVVTKIPDLIASFQDNIRTDFTPEQITQLACLGTKLRPQNIAFASFPEELFTPSRQIPDVYTHNPKGVFIWDVDFKILRDYVAQFQAGDWPPAESIEKETKEVVCE
ncbi:MAG: LCP family protein [Anaerolineales bacterium]|nr:LCP family protein [Anaerolineales bacterium]